MVFACRSFPRLTRAAAGAASAAALGGRTAPRIASLAGPARLRVPNQLPSGARLLTATSRQQGKVLLVLYDVSGRPPSPQLLFPVGARLLRGLSRAGPRTRQAGAQAPRDDGERAGHPEVDRGAGPHSRHHLRQGGRELHVRQGARRRRSHHHHPVSLSRNPPSSQPVDLLPSQNHLHRARE